MRSLLIAAFAALLALPAYAERKVCHVIRHLDGVLSETGAVLTPKFDRMLNETGPINTELKVAPDSKWKPLADAAPDASFYIYWLGTELAGKQWKNPGGVHMRIGGFGIQWPNFVSDGFRMRNFHTILRMGGAVSDRKFELTSAGYTMLSAQVMPMDKDMWSEWPHNWDHRIFFSDEWPAWLDAFRKGGKLTVEFYDKGDKPFATAAFNLPPLKAFTARALDDVKDFRANVDPVNCPAGSREPLP